MSVASQYLLAPQAAAGASSAFPRSASDRQFTIVVGGLAGAETANLQVLDASGNWQNVPAAVAPQFTSTVNTILVNAPGVFRVSKTATAGTVGVVLYAI